MKISVYYYTFYNYTFMNFTKTKIRNIINNIKSTINSCNNKFIKRQNNDKSKQLDFTDIIFASSHLVHASSYSISNSHLKINGKKYISNQAINKRRKNMDISLIDDINDKMLDHIYIPHKNTKNYKCRHIAVDGSQLNLNKNLHKDDFLLSKNKEYCKAKLGSLYDIDKGIPINYHLSDSLNEREILILQLKYVNKGDILIMDGGYYSEKLIGILIDRGINFIFRMPSTNLFVQNYNNDHHIFDIFSDNNKNVKSKIIKYFKNNEDRYLLTNLINCSTKTLKNKYMLRWDVETDFRKLKYDILYNNIRSKTKKQVLIDVKILNFISILLGQIEDACKVKNGCKINSKNTIELLYTDLLKLFLYKNMSNENLSKIYGIIGIIAITVELIRKNRYYKRRRITPSTKWNIYGNRYCAG